MISQGCQQRRWETMSLYHYAPGIVKSKPYHDTIVARVGGMLNVSVLLTGDFPQGSIV